MRVLVCGGRDFRDKSFLFETLDAIHAATPITLVIHGESTGVDYLANRWAGERPVRIRGFSADWVKHGKAAGPIRNQEMIDKCDPELVVAFPGGKGTADMVRRAKAAGIKVIEVPVAPQNPQS